MACSDHRDPKAVPAYSDEDESRVRLTKELIEGWPRRRLPRAMTWKAEPSSPERQDDGRVVDLAIRLQESLDAMDGAHRVIDRLLASMSVEGMLVDVILPYLRDLGERWATGEVSVAQEPLRLEPHPWPPARHRPGLGDRGRADRATRLTRRGARSRAHRLRHRHLASWLAGDLPRSRHADRHDGRRLLTRDRRLPSAPTDPVGVGLRARRRAAAPGSRRRAAVSGRCRRRPSRGAGRSGRGWAGASRTSERCRSPSCHRTPSAGRR